MYLFGIYCIKKASYLNAIYFQKLDNLEKEETLREEAGFYDESESEDDEDKRNIRELARKLVSPPFF